MVYFTQFLQHYAWLIKIGLIGLVGLVFSALEYYLYCRYLPRIVQGTLNWRQIILRAAHFPLISYIWLLAAAAILEILAYRLGLSDFVAPINPCKQILTLLLLFWFVMNLIKQWESSFIKSMDLGATKTFQDATSVNALAQILRVTAILLILLMTLRAVGISLSTLLAFGGVGGLAISFAAKDTLANFIGGLMIFWDKPFRIGDNIRSPDRVIEGTVENIGWRLTTIRTPEKRPLYIPNGTFSSIAVENTSRMTNRLFKTIIGLRYEDASKVMLIRNAIELFLLQLADIDLTQSISVRLIELGASTLNIQVSALIRTNEINKFLAIQEEILLKIIAIVDEYQAQMGYTTNTVHIAELEQIRKPVAMEI